MFKHRVLIFCIVFLLLLTGCTESFGSNYKSTERPHLYQKDIDVVVTDVSQYHWYAGYAHHYKVCVTVYNEEYNLTQTLTEEGSGMFADMPNWNTKKGDIIKVQLYSWVYDSTGEVIRRQIHDFVY